MVDDPWPDPREGNPHPRYGPCDSFGPRGECSQCKTLVVAMVTREQVERVATQLEVPLPHHECEDSWYSCPLSVEGSSGVHEQNRDPQKCYCYAEQVNAERTTAAALLRALLERAETAEASLAEAARLIPECRGPVPERIVWLRRNSRWAVEQDPMTAR